MQLRGTECIAMRFMQSPRGPPLRVSVLRQHACRCRLTRRYRHGLDSNSASAWNSPTDLCICPFNIILYARYAVTVTSASSSPASTSSKPFSANFCTDTFCSFYRCNSCTSISDAATTFATASASAFVFFGFWNVSTFSLRGR